MNTPSFANSPSTKWLRDHLRVVVMIAGKGQRFLGYSNLPKPMIVVSGKTILERTLDSLSFLDDLPRRSLWFVVRAEHCKDHMIDNWIRNTWGSDVNVISQVTPPSGNLDTAEEAARTIISMEPWAASDPILFLDGDNAYDGSSVEETLGPELDNDFANLYYFDQPNPASHWCFVKPNDDNGRIEEIREKEPFHGGKPIIGVFYFRKLSTFLHTAEYILDHSTTLGEFYMSQVFDLLVTVGVTPVYGYEIPNVIPLGTPDDVLDFTAKNVLDTSLAEAIELPKGPKKLRLCFDLDGTICETRRKDQYYIDVKPIPRAAEALRRWKEQGHTIIIYTARNMVTLNSNIGAITAQQVPGIISWLNRHNIPCDELLVGKPHADIFVDDAAHHHRSWAETEQVVDKLISKGGRFTT